MSFEAYIYGAQPKKLTGNVTPTNVGDIVATGLSAETPPATMNDSDGYSQKQFLWQWKAPVPIIVISNPLLQSTTFGLPAGTPDDLYEGTCECILIDGSEANWNPVIDEVDVSITIGTPP